MLFLKEILSFKTAFGQLWLAGTLGVKCRPFTRDFLRSSNVEKLVEAVFNVKEPLAPRLSGTFLLGVCLIYRQKQLSLHDDVVTMLQKVCPTPLKPTKIRAARQKMDEAQKMIRDMELEPGLLNLEALQQDVLESLIVQTQEQVAQGEASVLSDKATRTKNRKSATSIPPPSRVREEDDCIDFEAPEIQTDLLAAAMAVSPGVPREYEKMGDIDVVDPPHTNQENLQPPRPAESEFTETPPPPPQIPLPTSNISKVDEPERTKATTQRHAAASKRARFVIDQRTTSDATNLFTSKTREELYAPVFQDTPGLWLFHQRRSPAPCYRALAKLAPQPKKAQPTPQTAPAATTGPTCPEEATPKPQAPKDNELQLETTALRQGPGSLRRASVFSEAPTDFSAFSAAEKLRGLLGRGPERDFEADLGATGGRHAFSIGRSSMSRRSSIFGTNPLEDFLSSKASDAGGLPPSAARHITMDSWRLATLIDEQLEARVEGESPPELRLDDLLPPGTDAPTAALAFYQILVLAGAGQVGVSQSLWRGRDASGGCAPIVLTSAD